MKRTPIICEKCGEKAKLEFYYPEPNVRYSSYCEHCEYGVTEYDD